MESPSEVQEQSSGWGLGANPSEADKKICTWTLQEHVKIRNKQIHEYFCVILKSTFYYTDHQNLSTEQF